jgi:hypothetical protein
MANFSSVNGQSATLLATKGLVRPNRFSVNISFPNTQGITKFQEYVESVEFPAMAIGTADYQYNTQPILKIPYAKLPAQTCNITFRLDGSGNPVKALYDAIEQIVSYASGDYYVAYAESIWGDIIINALDIKDIPIYNLTLSKVLITNIDTTQYSFDERDSYLKQTVSFAYQEAEVQTGGK